MAEQNSDLDITILEKTDVLNKLKYLEEVESLLVRIIPKLTGYYQGEKELLDFHGFMTGDTMAWFEERGVELKIEDDGRIFPISNSSQTIIDYF